MHSQSNLKIHTCHYVTIKYELSLHRDRHSTALDGEDFNVLLLRRYVLSALPQLTTRTSNRGLIQREPNSSIVREGLTCRKGNKLVDWLLRRKKGFD